MWIKKNIIKLKISMCSVYLSNKTVLKKINKNFGYCIKTKCLF